MGTHYSRELGRDLEKQRSTVVRRMDILGAGQFRFKSRFCHFLVM